MKNNMNFETLEKNIEELNKIKPFSTRDNNDRYYRLYNTIYEALLEMEKDGTIVVEDDTRTLSYLRTLLENDGPEFSYTFTFHEKSATKKYRIGVCIRGLPICKPEQ